MHCRYFSAPDCSIRVSRSFVQFLCPLHKNCTYYASILLIAFTHPLCQNFAGEIDGSLDISNLEHLQRRATNYILNDYISDYKTRLLKLELLPLMYTIELSDIMFFIKSIKNPTSSFTIHHFISFSTSARSGGFKLHHNPSTTNKQRHFYFVRICRLWNALPLIDVNLSIDTIRNRVKSHFWNHFIHNFDPLNPHTLHYHCPCSRCVTDHFSINYTLF